MCPWGGLLLHGTSKRVIKSCCYHVAIFLIKWKYWSSLSCSNFVFGPDICIFTACFYNRNVIFLFQDWEMTTQTGFHISGTLSYGNYNRGFPYQAFGGSLSDSCLESLLFMASTSWRFFCGNRCHHVLIASGMLALILGKCSSPWGQWIVCWGWPWKWD